MPRKQPKIQEEDDDFEDDLSFRSNILIFEEEEDDISLTSETASQIFLNEQVEEASNQRYKTIGSSIFGDDRNSSTSKRNKDQVKKVSFRSEPNVSSSSSQKQKNTQKGLPKKKVGKTNTSSVEAQTKSMKKANKSTDTKKKVNKDKVQHVEAVMDSHDPVALGDGDQKEIEKDVKRKDAAVPARTTKPIQEDKKKSTAPVKESVADDTSTSADEKTPVETKDSGNTLEFKDQHITFGRRVSRVLSSIPCLGNIYNPTQTKTAIIVKGANIEEGRPEKSVPPPSLEKGWEFYEHWILPRCFVKKTLTPSENEDSTSVSSFFKRWIGNQRKYIRADAGEKEHETMLYPLWGTSMADMADFGTGVGLYFKMLRYFMVVTFIAGLLSIPLMVYYSKEYARSDLDGSGQISKIINMINVGSAVCTNARWEVCPSCNNSDIPAFRNARRILTANRTFMNESGYSQTEKIGFIYKNYCQFDAVIGIWNLVVLMFLVVATLVYMIIHRRQYIAMDDAQKSTSDYSILITNPPDDATDPNVWKNFFEDRFNVHVTLCTVVLDNQDMLLKIIKRRKLLTMLRNYLPLNEEFDENDLKQTLLRCSDPGLLWRILGSKGPKDIYDEILELNKEIEDSAQSNFPASNIFITFETEGMQYEVLKKMTYAKAKKIVDSKYKFDGLTLKIKEPDEPSAIRWTDLDENPKSRRRKKIITFVLIAILIIGLSFALKALYLATITGASIVIVAMNAAIPAVVRFIISFESHPNETSYERSNYLKITYFRWIFTVIVLGSVCPFPFTLQDGDHLVESVRIVFFAELILKPLIQLWDWLGHCRRYFLAPHAKDQKRLNLWFSGRQGNIGEKYTDFTKVFFLACFSCSLFPGAWFLTSIILFVNLWVDKYSILRMWKQGPRSNAKVSSYTIYFILICLITLAVTSSFNIAQFPFDNACPTDETPPSYYIGNYIIDTKDVKANFTITEESPVYKFCNMNMYSYFVFPPVPEMLPSWSNWMSEYQIKLSKINGLAALSIIVIVSIVFIGRLGFMPLFAVCCKPTKTKIKNSTPFSNLSKSQFDGYIPQVKVPGHLYPFILCDVNDINSNLIGWHGCDKNNDTYDGHNISHDIAKVINGTDNVDNRRVKQKHLLSIVKHWPPVASDSGKDEDRDKESTSRKEPFRKSIKKFFYK